LPGTAAEHRRQKPLSQLGRARGPASDPGRGAEAIRMQLKLPTRLNA